MSDNAGFAARLESGTECGAELSTQGEKAIVNVLISSVAAMLIPLLIAHATGDKGTLSVSIPAAFLVVLTLISALHFRRGHRLPPAALVGAVWIGIAQLLPLWWGGFLGDPLFAGDVANAIVKPVAFLLFIGFFLRASFSDKGVSSFARRFTLIVFIVALYGSVNGLASFTGLGLGVSSYSVEYSSFLANRNQFGMLLFLGLSFLLIARAARGPWWYDVPVGITLSVSIVLTMSRGSILGAVLLLVIVSSLRRPSSFTIALFPAVGFGAFLLGLNPVVRQYVAHFLIRPEVGLSGRDAIWGIGLQLAAERPLNGWGAYAGLAEAETRGLGAGQLHSFWLEQLVDWGALGLVSVVIVFIVVWARAYRSAPRRVRHALLGVAVGAVAMGSVESINVLSVGYVDVVWTISLLTVPVLLSRVNWSASQAGVVEVDQLSGRDNPA